MSPAVTGGFLTTRTPGKPPAKYIFIFRYNLRSSEVGKPSSLKSHCFSLIQLSPETSQPKRYTFFFILSNLLNRLQFYVPVDQAAMNIHVQVFVGHVFISLE